MGILRSDIVSHSQLEPTGSVTFDGTGDNLSLSLANGGIGEGDFTLEYFVYQNTLSDYQTHFAVTRGSTGFNVGTDSNGVFTLYDQVSSAARKIEVSGAIEINRWYHWAFVRSGSTITGYLDGEAIGLPYSQSVNYSGTTCTIGSLENNSEYMNGFISNLRLVKGAIYKNNFTPPKFELKNVPGTLLLCCQSSSSATTASVKPGTITANGNAAASAFIPDLKKDITDTGPVFGENTVFDTLSYMVPPGGTTTQSNRGRGLLMGGAVSPGATNTTQIKYFDIASQGTTDEFGQTTVARRATGSLSSSTRAVMGGGFVAPPSPYTISDVMDYVTIATTANAIDFGNMQSTAYHYATASNETRGLFAGGYRPNNSAVVNTIDLITIATTGNASNFGDLTRTARSFGGAGSTTRGVFFGGTHPAIQDVIDYVTFSTTGDATDFGNLTDARDNAYGASSSTRAVMAGGRDPNTTNIIDYITIASTGDATDFGDLTQTSYYFNASTSNSIRAVWVGTSTIVNSMEYVTIATTGNSVDWGDQGGTIQHSGGACSDSHGGIS